MAAPATTGYRKVGRVLFVHLRRAHLVRWNQETRLAALQLGLTRIGKTVVLPDLPQYRDLCLTMLPWVTIDSKTTDEVKQMLNVPDGIKWQELRDNIPEMEESYLITAQMTRKNKINFQRELMWLKDEMREQLGITYVKPGDHNDPSEAGATLFCFDDVTKEYWKLYTKDKMRNNRRWARFFPTPQRGFNEPNTAEALSMFYPRMGRGEAGMTLHTKAVPPLCTTASRHTGRMKFPYYAPLRKYFNPHSDFIVPVAKFHPAISHY